MDQASAQTEKIASYETSRTRRSIVDGTLHKDDSNNDEEYATSGFYVREKTTEKKSDSAGKDSDKDCKENGVSSQENSPRSPEQNGEDSEDEKNSKESKKVNDTNEANAVDKESEKKTDPIHEKDIGSQNDDTSSSSEQDDKKEGSEKESSVVEPEEQKLDKDCDKIENPSSSKLTKVDEDSGGEEESNDETKEVKEKDSKQAEGEKNEGSSDKQDTSKNETSSIESGNNKEKSNQINEEGTNDTKQDEKKSQEDETQDQADATKEDVKENSNKPDKDGGSEAEKEKSEGSILKDHLEKSSNGNNEEAMDAEMEMDEDFDPSLLCPDISMDVDEAPVITNSDHAQDDGSTSPLPYEATFSTLVDEITGAEVQVDLTPEEMELRTKMYGPNNLVQTTKVHCTACNIHLGSALTGANNRFVHPLLKVLICKNCYHFYTSGEFEKDEDGSELYCRWCGQGGQVLCCSSCEFVFCKRCIRNNFGPKKFKEIRDSDDWNCFRCDRGQLSNLRASCAEFMEYYRTELARAQAMSRTNPELMTTDYTTCCRGGSEKKDENKTPVQPKATRKKRKHEDDPDYRPIVEEDGEPPKQLEQDAANWIRFKTMGSKIIMKPHVVPHLYLKSPPEGELKSQFTSSCRKRKREFISSLEKSSSSQETSKIGEEIEEKLNTSTGGPGYTVIPPVGSTIRPLMPKPMAGQVIRPVIMQQGQKPQNQGQVFKVGNTTFRAKAPTSGPGYTLQRPTGQKSNSSPGYITIPPSAAPKSNSPGYITIPPSAAPKTTSPGYIKILPQRMQGPRPTSTYTVVSGTSNGKPTFTTVRPKQAAPVPSMKHEWFEKTVRAAARVNSNLSYTLTQLNRQQSQANSVEALAMVHNKLQEVLSTSINSLIQIRKNLRTEFISGIKNIKFPPKPAPIPQTSGPILVKDDDDVIFVNPSTPAPASTLPPPPPLVLSPSVSLSKRTPLQKTSDPFADPKPSTSGVTPKSSTSTPLTTMPTKAGGFLKVRSFTSLQSVPSECITIPDDPPASSDVKIIEEEDPLKITEDEDKPKDDKKEVPKSPVPEEAASSFDETMVYDVKDKPTLAIKKMLGAVVMVKKSRVVDEIIRAQGLLSGKGKELKDKENKEKEKESMKKEIENDSKKEQEEEKETENEAKTQEETDNEAKKQQEESDSEAKEQQENKEKEGKKQQEETDKEAKRQQEEKENEAKKQQEEKKIEKKKDEEKETESKKKGKKEKVSEKKSKETVSEENKDKEKDDEKDTPSKKQEAGGDTVEEDSGKCDEKS